MKFEVFSTYFRKIVRYQISWKSVQWKGELFHADGQTDNGKLVVAFRNLAEAPKYSVPVLQKTHDKEQVVGAAGDGVGVGVGGKIAL